MSNYTYSRPQALVEAEHLDDPRLRIVDGLRAGRGDSVRGPLMRGDS